MTDSNAETSSVPPASTAGSPRLRRRATDRVVGGVAAGIADHVNVDPLLVRVAFVGLVLFGGAGFFIYLAALLFIPVEGRDDSIVEDWVRRLGISGGPWSTIVVIVVAIILASIAFNTTDSVGDRVGVDPGFFVALVVIVGGILLVRRTPERGVMGGSASPATAAASPPATATPAAAEPVRRPPRERSPLGLFVLGATLLTIGVMAAVDGATPAQLLPGQYAGIALGLLGAGLIVGAWWGRARWLILVGLLLLPAAIAMSFVRVPLDGGWGDRRVTPTSASEVLGEYRLAGGRLTLDLSELPRSAEGRHVSASVAVGRLLVIVPAGARTEVTSTVGAGTSDLLGTRQEGTGFTDSSTLDGAGAPIVLDLEVGIGDVLVRTAQTGD